MIINTYQMIITQINQPLVKQCRHCTTCNFILVNFVSSIIVGKLIPRFDDILVSPVCSKRLVMFPLWYRRTALSWIITFQITKMHETFDALRALVSFWIRDNLQTRYQIQSSEYFNFTQRTMYTIYKRWITQINKKSTWKPKKFEKFIRLVQPMNLFIF